MFIYFYFFLHFLCCLLVDLECASLHARFNPAAPNRALDSNLLSRSLCRSFSDSTHFLTLSALCCTPAMILLQPVSTETSQFQGHTSQMAICRPKALADWPPPPNFLTHIHTQTFAYSTMSQASQIWTASALKVHWLSGLQRLAIKETDEAHGHSFVRFVGILLHDLIYKNVFQ